MNVRVQNKRNENVIYVYVYKGNLDAWQDAVCVKTERFRQTGTDADEMLSVQGLQVSDLVRTLRI